MLKVGLTMLMELGFIPPIMVVLFPLVIVGILTVGILNNVREVGMLREVGIVPTMVSKLCVSDDGLDKEVSIIGVVEEKSNDCVVC